MQRFADRGFVSINGVEVEDLVSANVTRGTGLQRKSTMTRSGRDAGYSSGNISVQVALELAVQKKKAQIDLALADEEADVRLVFECGGERLSVIGLAESSMTLNSSVGDVSKSISLEGLDIINELGESVNGSISLG